MSDVPTPSLTTSLWNLGTTMVGTAVQIGRQVPALLAEAPRAVEALPGVLAELGTLPRRVAGVNAALAALAPVLADVLGRVTYLADDAEVVDRVDRLTTAVIELAGAVEPLRELAGAREDLSTLAGAVEPLRELARAREDLSTLSGAVAPLTELALAREDIAVLAGAVAPDGPVPRIAAAVDDPTGAPAVGAESPRLVTLDVSLARAADQLATVAPDLRSVAARIDALDRQIGVLADALAPLQGTTERIGRIVDRFPDRSRRGLTT
ncbi:MAG: hypothetical protein L0I76_08050 [Pseudonocardia sp.]|nr:hypothetical protein [Pseudonocardia sp.]